MSTSAKKPDFEKSLTELENLVAKLESGELTLDQSLQYFKRGVELTRLCQSVLDEAQKTVELLNKSESESGHSTIERPA